ncbi:MAG: hypothetical protein M3463_07475 [Verrucomicrobiota bacterium]|nr:hypothetical protein [Verrucomicrobiota bacterium]
MKRLAPLWLASSLLATSAPLIAATADAEAKADAAAFARRDWVDGSDTTHRRFVFGPASGTYYFQHFLKNENTDTGWLRTPTRNKPQAGTPPRSLKREIGKWLIGRPTWVRTRMEIETYVVDAFTSLIWLDDGSGWDCVRSKATVSVNGLEGDGRAIVRDPIPCDLALPKQPGEKVFLGFAVDLTGSRLGRGEPDEQDPADPGDESMDAEEAAMVDEAEPPGDIAPGTEVSFAYSVGIGTQRVAIFAYTAGIDRLPEGEVFRSVLDLDPATQARLHPESHGEGLPIGPDQLKAMLDGKFDQATGTWHLDQVPSISFETLMATGGDEGAVEFTAIAAALSAGGDAQPAPLHLEAYWDVAAAAAVNEPEPGPVLAQPAQPDLDVL